MQAEASVPWISHLFRTGEALALQALASDYTVSLQHDACGSALVRPVQRHLRGGAERNVCEALA